MATILIRGVYNGEPQTRIEDYLYRKVDEELAAGRIVRVCARDIMRLAKTGTFLLPKSLLPDNHHIPQCSNMELLGFSSSILYRMRPNSGTLKKEIWGKNLVYEFVPKVVSDENDSK